MATAQRLELIRRIQKLRGSRVIAYVCSDRQGAAAQIGDDAVRSMYDHVRRIGKTESIDLYLYSRGGAVEVPWRMVSMLREYCDELNVLIPYRAHSAATLIALGCDGVVMGRKAELGPIDPAVNRITHETGTPVQEQIRVEDVMSYIGFLKEKAGLGDQQAIAENVRVLSEKLSPWVLGSIYRTHSHIRMVSRKLLTCHKARLDGQKASLIIESLAEKTYLHGHGIGRREAKDLGLPVTEPEPELEEAMWELLEQYEATMEMRHPIDTDAIMGEDADEWKNPIIISVIESEDLTSVFGGSLVLRRIRQPPGQLNINLNLGLSLPPGLDLSLIPQAIIDQLLQQFKREVPLLVREQLRNQSAVVRVEGGVRNGRWRTATPDEI